MVSGVYKEEKHKQVKLNRSKYGLKRSPLKFHKTLDSAYQKF